MSSAGEPEKGPPIGIPLLARTCHYCRASSLPAGLVVFEALLLSESLKQLAIFRLAAGMSLIQFLGWLFRSRLSEVVSPDPNHDGLYVPYG